jgi:enolase-phosphatase E1
MESREQALGVKSSPSTTRRSHARKTPPGMLRFPGQGILLDIEGTLCSRSYFADVLAPHARRHLASFLRSHWFDGAVAAARDQIAQEAAGAKFEQWCESDPRSAEAFVRLYDEVLQQLQSRRPSAGVRELLQLSWRDGYRTSQLVTHIFPHVHTALETWVKAERDVRTFAAISVGGQCDLLAKTEQGNLLGFFRDHYDAAMLGPKRAPGSYCTIADDMRLAPHALLYVSDEAAELDAARIAGYTTAFIVRPGNPPPPASSRHPLIHDLRAILVG